MSLLSIHYSTPTFIHFVFGHILCSSGIIINAIVIGFTFKKSNMNDNMEQRFITRANSFINLYSTLICLIVHPQIEIIQNKILFRCYGFGGNVKNDGGRLFLVGIFIFSYVMILSSVSVGLLFRYNILCKRILLSKSKLIRFYFICFGYSICSSILYSSNFSPNVPMNFRTEADLNESIWKYEEPPFWDHVLINRENNILLLLSLILYVSLTISSYTIITYFVVKMKKLMRNNKNIFSTKTIILQKQLNTILNVQSITPIIVILLPILFGIILILSKVRANGFALFIILGLESVPFFNGLSVIILTKEYRIGRKCTKITIKKTISKIFVM
uniref:G_PROTEIN_RECEP_F1_2 domain-containing protein n=1 Tax=Strongyloides papillosus TaxID=174720 RepID=A0A0N5BCQ9_STREA